MQLRCIAQRRIAPLTQPLNAPFSAAGADEERCDRGEDAGEQISPELSAIRPFRVEVR